MTYEHYENLYLWDSSDAFDILNDRPNVEAFEHFNAQAWIDAYAVYRSDGTIDIDATAEKVGVPVFYTLDNLNRKSYGIAALSGSVGGEPFRVHLGGNHSKEWNISFGHELGHLFLQTAMEVEHRLSNREEPFCDYFGMRMAISSAALEGYESPIESDIIELAERLGVDHGAIILRFMQQGKLPEQLIVDVNYPSNVPNPFFRGKLNRKIMCLRCFTEEPHEKIPIEIAETLPRLDLTPYDVFDFPGYLPFNHNLCEPGRKDSWFIALNEQYGRWTEEDKPMLEQRLREEALMIQHVEKAREKRLRNLGKTSQTEN